MTLANLGLIVESNIVKLLNEKKYDELSDNGKNIVSQIYSIIDDEEKIVCKKIEGRYKPDIYISYLGEEHFISVKSGNAEHVHMEHIDAFIKFLDENHISKKTQETILLFQFGDGTLDGSGEVRRSYADLFPEMQERIALANEELNFSREFVWKFIDCALFKGFSNSEFEADFIYHGSENFGVLVSRSAIRRHVIRKNYGFFHNLHIGPIQFNPYARYINFNGKNEDKRFIVNFHWVRLVSDLQYITNYRR